MGKQTTNGQAINFSDAQDAKSATISTNTTIMPQDKIDKIANPVAEDDYLVSFYCEMKTDTPGTSACHVEILVDSDAKAESNWGENQWHAFSGTSVFTFANGDTPRIQLQFKRIGAAATVSVRRAYVALVPITRVAA